MSVIAPRISTAALTDIATATPAEIDTRLADLVEAHATASDRAERYATLAAETKYEFQRPGYQADADEYAAIAKGLEPEISALSAEFIFRGRWTRAFLAVTNGSGGHVHSSRRCSTCNNGESATQFAWVTEFSGHDEDEIVEAAGNRACTVCYPTAPVEVLNRATTIFTKDEQRIAAERAEREAKKAAAATATITDVLTGEVIYKTERAALNAASAALDSTLWYGGHPSDQEWADTVTQAVAAVAAKNGTDAKALLAELEAKAAKKFAAKVRKVVKEALATKGRTPAHFDNSDPAGWYASIREEATRQGLI
jgi:hypothetical protein